MSAGCETLDGGGTNALGEVSRRMARWHVRLVVGALLTAGCHDTTRITSTSARLRVTAVTDGQTYAVDATGHHIELGAVPVFGARLALFALANVGRDPLTIDGIDVAATEGGRWELRPPALPRVSAGAAWPRRLDAGATATLEVLYAPRVAAAASITVAVRSIDAEGGTGAVTVSVGGSGGPPLGHPALALVYGAYAGPAPTDCATRFDGSTKVIDRDPTGAALIEVCRIPDASALDFGNIGLGARGAARLTLRNTAACPILPDLDPCDTCALTVAVDPTRAGVGLGFMPGTNDDGFFAFDGAQSLPVVVRQQSVACGATGELPLVLGFAAPAVVGVHTTTLAVESDDPGAPLVLVPVTATARDAPVAVATLRAPDPLDPGAPPRAGGLLEPLTRVYLDGRGSYDPAAPGDPTRLARWRWEVVSAPAGANAADLAPAGTDGPLFDFFAPIAGRYVAHLRITNVDGIDSGDTDSATVEVAVVPRERFHLELLWDTATDLDLHLVTAPGEGRLCNELTAPADCFWRDCEPACATTPGCHAFAWDPSSPPYQGPNPRLDKDNRTGYGPENIRIAAPAPGRYRIYVQYFAAPTAPDVPPTRATVRVYVDGSIAAEYRRSLTAERQVWAVADLVWSTGGEVVARPSDAAFETGAVALMPDGACTEPGWSFPTP